MAKWPGNTQAAYTFRTLKAAIKAFFSAAELLENMTAKDGHTKKGGKK